MARTALLRLLLLVFASPLLVALPSQASAQTVDLYVTLYHVEYPFEAPRYCASITNDAQVTATAGDFYNLCFIVRNRTGVALNHHEFRADGVLFKTIDHPIGNGGMEIVYEQRMLPTRNLDVTYTVTSSPTAGGTPYTSTARLRLDTRIPQIALSREAFQVTAVTGAVAQDGLTLSNVGRGPLTWHLGEYASAGSDRDPASGQTPAGGAPVASRPAYAIETSGSQQTPVRFDLEAPLPATPLSATLSDIRAGTFVDGDFTRQILLEGSGRMLALDLSSGQTSVLSSNTRPMPADQNWLGTAWDPVERRLYGLSARGDAAAIYRIQPGTGAVARVGDVNIYRRAMRGVYSAIASDSDGRIYAIDASNDLLIRIMFDPYDQPGHVSGYTIGPLGFDVEGVAGLTIDAADHTMYLSARDAATGQASLYRVDSATGAATPIAALASGEPRIAMAALDTPRPCSAEGDVAWLSLSPYAAAPLAQGESSEVRLFLDARRLPAGVYESHACIHSNDPQRSKIAVPVRLTVLPDTQPDAIFADGFEP